MPLIQNPAFSNERVVIGSYVVQFNEVGIADFPDQKLIDSLLQIPGFSLVEEASPEPPAERPSPEDLPSAEPSLAEVPQEPLSEAPSVEPPQDQPVEEPPKRSRRKSVEDKE